MKLVLASASPRRSELLKSLGLEFEVKVAPIQELHEDFADPVHLCKTNAELKARAVADGLDALVIGADTLVALSGRVFGKPKDLAQARMMLAQLSGRTHQVFTSVCLCQRQSIETFTEKTDVTFRDLTPNDIDGYLRSVPVLDKAGAYGIQEQGHILVERISGSFSNVVGLPLEALRERLSARGVTVQPRS